jgi:hypothetical protein
MARVSAAHSARVMPRKNTAIANAAIWASLTEPSAMPATRCEIAASLRSAPSPLLANQLRGAVAPGHTPSNTSDHSSSISG